jgi:hypothetical protein
MMLRASLGLRGTPLLFWLNRAAIPPNAAYMIVRLGNRPAL